MRTLFLDRLFAAAERPPVAYGKPRRLLSSTPFQSSSGEWPDGHIASRIEGDHCVVPRSHCCWLDDLDVLFACGIRAGQRHQEGAPRRLPCVLRSLLAGVLRKVSGR